MISAVARCWNGMAQGRDEYAQLEEGRSKLLLSTVPQGLSVATEVLKRLTLWEEQSYETLLQRAEEQLLLKRRSTAFCRQVAHTDAALLATQEERQTASH